MAVPALAIPRDATVAVVGAGTMGGGIAQVAAQAGHRVRLFDTRLGAAEKMRASIGETLKGYDASTLYGVLAPARTPRPIITTLHAEIVKILGVVETRDRLLAQGFEPVGGTPAEFGTYIKAEIAKWAKVIKAAGIKPE